MGWTINRQRTADSFRWLQQYNRIFRLKTPLSMHWFRYILTRAYFFSLLQHYHFEKFLGTEFVNHLFREFCKHHSIIHINPFSHVKAVYIERLNQTIKKLLHNHMLEIGNENFLSVQGLTECLAIKVLNGLRITLHQAT